jgi:NADH-ubiquinone oxidoreductase chain 6
MNKYRYIMNKYRYIMNKYRYIIKIVMKMVKSFFFMLYTIFEFSYNGFSVISLNLIDILAILSGILVIITKNPILSVLFLILLFGSISGHLILSGLNFIGIAYLLVYIGAVSILFLFILMLINVRISELLTDSINSIPLAILMGIFFILFVDDSSISLLINFFKKIHLLNYSSSISWDGNIAETSHITSIGNILYGNYSIWLIITTIILLLAMVGSIVITLKDKTNTGVTINDLTPHSFTSLPLKSGMDSDSVPLMLDLFFKMKASSAVAIQNCGEHAFNLKVAVTTSEVAAGNVPNCSFNASNGVNHSAIYPTWKEFYGCSKCYAVTCINCLHQSSIFLITNGNIFLILLSTIRKIRSVYVNLIKNYTAISIFIFILFGILAINAIFI